MDGDLEVIVARFGLRAYSRWVALLVRVVESIDRCSSLVGCKLSLPRELIRLRIR